MTALALSVRHRVVVDADGYLIDVYEDLWSEGLAPVDARGSAPAGADSIPVRVSTPLPLGRVRDGGPALAASAAGSAIPGDAA